MNPRTRKRLQLCLSLLILLLLLAAGVFYALREAILSGWLIGGLIYAPNHGQTIDPNNDPKPDELRQLGVDRQMRISVGDPEASLSVWIMEPKDRDSDSTDTVRGTILLLHGIRGNKRHMLGTGQLLSQHGFRSILVDLRGHGLSSGNWLSYGARESCDLSQLINALDKEGLITGKIGAYGTSYGGAVSIMLAGIDPRIEAVVTVATFSSLHDVVPCYVRRYLWPIGYFISRAWVAEKIDEAASIADFNAHAASAIEAIQVTHAPVLLIHGKNDGHIPFSQSETIHAAAPEHSRLLLIDSEDHDSIMADRSGILSREMTNWFEQYLNPQQSEDCSEDKKGN